MNATAQGMWFVWWNWRLQEVRKLLAGDECGDD